MTSRKGSSATSKSGREPLAAGLAGSSAAKSMTWAERLSGKVAVSAAAASPAPLSTTSSSSITLPISSLSETGISSSAPGISAITTTSGSQSEGTKDLVDPSAQKTRAPTDSTDSGWGESESYTSIIGTVGESSSTSLSSSHSPHLPSASLSGSADQAYSTSKPANAINPETLNEANSKSTAAEEGDSLAPLPSKPPSGPPKVNVWQVRREQADKKAAELKTALEKEPKENGKERTSFDGLAEAEQTPQYPSRTQGGSGQSGKRRKGDSASTSSNTGTFMAGALHQSQGASFSTHSGKSNRTGQALRSQNGTSKAPISSGHSNTRGQTPSTAANNTIPTKATSAIKHDQEALFGTPSISQISGIAPSDDSSKWPSPVDAKDKEDKEIEQRNRSEKEEKENSRDELQTTSSSADKKKPKWIPIQAEITINAPLPSKHRSGSVSRQSAVGEARSAKSSTSGGSATSADRSSRSASKESRTAQSPADEIVASSLPLSNGRMSRSHSQVSSSAAPSLPTGAASGAIEKVAPVPVPDKSAITSPLISHRPGPPSRQISSSLHASLPAKPVGAPTTNLSHSPHTGSRQRLSPSLPTQSMSQHQSQTLHQQSPSVVSPAGSTSSPAVTPSLSTTSTTLESATLSSNASVQKSNATRKGTRISDESEPLNSGLPHQQQQMQQSGYHNISGPSSFAQPGRGGKRGGSFSASRGGRGGLYGDRARGGYSGGTAGRNNSPSQYIGGLNGQQHQSPASYQPYMNGYYDPSFAAGGQNLPYYSNPTPGGPAFYAPQMYGQPSIVPYYVPAAASAEQRLGAHDLAGSGTSSQPGSPPHQSMSLPYSSAVDPGQFAETGLSPYNAYSYRFGTPQPLFNRPAPLFNYDGIAFPPDGTAFWVLGQIEFYLSPDNLVKDVFLRQSMDEEGWIDIPLIASFNRLKQLTVDVNVVREMMNISYMCEVREMKTRTREWQQWIIPGAKKSVWENQQVQPMPQHQTEAIEQNPAHK